MNKLQNLEKKFNVANDLMEELTEVANEFEKDLIPVQSNLPVEVDEEKVFSIETLKSDFLLVRNNIVKLINTGQRILDQASILDISDLKASQLQALSDLQSTLGNNLKMLISIYKEISEIEKLRVPTTKQEIPSQINTGSITNNNIVFSGSSEELLTLIKQNQ